MEQIKFYLKKFENLEIKGDRLKTKLIKILQDDFDIKVEKKEVVVLKTGVIKILKTGPEKTQIFLNKKKIEERIQKEVI